MRDEHRLQITDGDADTAVIAAYERDRRALLRRGIAFGGGVVAASSIPLLMSVRNAFAAGATGDAGVLERAIAIERATEFWYQGLAANPHLSNRVRATIALFYSQELQHGAVLIKALKALGGTPVTKPRSALDLAKLKLAAPPTDSQTDVLNFSIALETASVASYHDAQHEIQDGELMQTAASIMAAEGQHLVVLRQALRRDPVPDAFETGAK